MADTPPEETEVVRLAKLVALMRGAQKSFFESRHATVLTQSKDLERRVDKAVKWVLAHRQGELFAAPQPDLGPYASDKMRGL